MDKFGKFKIIVAGCRTFKRYDILKEKLDLILSKLPKDKVEIISGCAKGADTLAIQYAEENKYKVWRFPPDWKHFGKRAGIIRNTMMAETGTHLVAFWDLKSRGTGDMIKQAKEHGLTVKVINISKYIEDDKVDECPGTQVRGF